MDLLITLLYILFVLSALVLVVVILLQEGKGGGLGDALGTAGQQTFGVKASGIQRFTAIVTIVFVASAILIHILYKRRAEGTLGSSLPRVESPWIDAPADGGLDVERPL